jgi:hypothetical protein
MAWGYGSACPKPLPHKVTKVRQGKVDKVADEQAREEIRILYKRRCQVCGRKTNTVHEHKRRGAGGIVCVENSFTACDLIDGGMCHPLLQARQIVPLVDREPLVEGDDVRATTGFRMNTPVHKLVFAHRAQPTHIDIQD